jgi:ubiquitin-activating enzyme E1
MCTVHSFPHNIDHCLTWARSEFEGLLEKGPSEANAYLADPAKYTGEGFTAPNAGMTADCRHKCMLQAHTWQTQ